MSASVETLQRIARLEKAIRDLREYAIGPGLYNAFDDQQVNISNVRLPASGAPTWVGYKGSQVLSFSASQTNTVYFTVQFSHKYRQETDVEFHLHTTYTDTNAGNVYWRLTHSWASIGAGFPAETTVNTLIAAPGVADRHEVDEVVAAITGTGKYISSLMLCSLARIGGDGTDTYGSAVYLAADDFHFEVNSLGSRTATAK